MNILKSIMNLGGIKMNFNFKKTNKVYGYYYYCTNCNRQLDYYEYLRKDGLWDNCRKYFYLRFTPLDVKIEHLSQVIDEEKWKIK